MKPKNPYWIKCTKEVPDNVRTVIAWPFGHARAWVAACYSAEEKVWYKAGCEAVLMPDYWMDPVKPPGDTAI